MRGPPESSSQAPQGRLAQALHDFGDVTDDAARAWARHLTVRQGLDITYVLSGILPSVGNAARKLSTYRAQDPSGESTESELNSPNRETCRAADSIKAARAALVPPFQEALQASGGWAALGGDPAQDGLAIFMAHLLYRRTELFDEPWPELSGTIHSRNNITEELICAVDGLASAITNLARDAPEPMRSGLTETVARLEDAFGHLRESFICSTTHNYEPGTEELARELRRTIPIPGRAQALRTRHEAGGQSAVRSAATDFPWSATDAATLTFHASYAPPARAARSRPRPRRSRPG